MSSPSSRHRSLRLVHAAGRRSLRAVIRDVVRDDSGDEDRQFELCQVMYWMRHVVLTVSLVAMSFRDGVGQTEVLIAAALLTEATSHVIVRRDARRARSATIVDVSALVVLAALGLPAPLVLVMAVGVLGWAATFRPLPAVVAGAGALAAVVTSYSLHRSHFTTWAAVAGFVLLGAIFLVRTIRMNMGARRSTEREHLVAQGIEAILWEADPELNGALKVSLVAERVLGHPVAIWAEPGFLGTIVHPDDRGVLRKQMDAGRDGSVTVRLRRSDGSYRWMENRCNWISDRSGRHRFAVGVMLDRTDQVEAERESMAFGHLVASSPIGQMLLHCDGKRPVIDAMNHACQTIFSADSSAIGRPLSSLGDGDVSIEELVELLRSGVSDQSIEFIGADQRIHQATVRRIDSASCSVDFLDITERVQAGRQLHAQARHDYLTGLPNRRAFIEVLEARIAAGERPAVVILDLDDFKDINDALGHDTGDQLLVQIGRTIVDGVRERDLVARLGGDEFAVVLSAADEQSAVRRAVSLVEQINQPVEVGELRLRVRASAGVATISRVDGEATAAELMRCADVAMYLAKSHGSGAELYAAGVDRFDSRRLSLVAELESAISAGELVLHHQPLVDVASGDTIGTEVLARWQHHELGLIPPDVFIELAEVSGQMKNLTRWVIRQALTDLRSLGAIGEQLHVSVNLSVRNLYEADLVEWLAATLAELHVAPRRLVVEITESTMMDDQSAAIEVILALRRLGVRTWIDDFGTGHSSFARLRSLPVDGVKIDRSFVCDSFASSNDQILLRSLVELLHSLGLQVIAEGVEESETMELLQNFGCDLAQGFALARPMPLPALVESLRVTEVVQATMLTIRPGTTMTLRGG